MSQESMEIALVKYNKKTWCKSALLGFIIGLAVIVPGISGSTVAIIFKLYDQFLYAIGNLFKRFKACFVFLLPIGIGLIVGFLLGFFSVKKLLDINVFAVICLFAGLMSGSFPAVKDELKGAKRTPKRVVLFLIGLAIPVIMGCLSSVLSVNAPAEEGTEEILLAENMFYNLQWWHVALALLVGFVVGITQIVPGLSASAFLMAIGWYGDLMQFADVKLTLLRENPLTVFVLLGIGIGFVTALLTCSNLLTWLFRKMRHDAYSMIVGLSLGSIVSMFCNAEVIPAYLSWATAGNPWRVVLDVVLGIALFAVGFVAAYLLIRLERKKTAEKTVDPTAEPTENTP